MLTASDFFNLDRTEHAALFANTTYVWDAIKHIDAYIEKLLETSHSPNADQLDLHPSIAIEGDVHIGAGTTIAPGVYIQGPVVIGENCEIRHGALVRSHVLLGNGAIIGHASEAKNSVLLENAHAPHFAYLGESILGIDTNLGAGTKLSNLPVNSIKDPQTGKRSTIILNIDGVSYDTGLSKFGAILGDGAQTGCNCVTNPGCVIGRGTWVYPLASLSKGYYPPNSLIKLRQQVEIVPRRQ